MQVLNLTAVKKNAYIFQVMFRKIMGDPPVGQIAFTFSMIGLMNAALLWPICLALYFSGTEQMPSDTIPWAILIMACVLMLGNVYNIKYIGFSAQKHRSRKKVLINFMVRQSEFLIQSKPAFMNIYIYMFRADYVRKV
jgi:hypothetical protein